jgi:8-oxo-dGTP pyrophosphatase MutT (NUDIX family)
MEPKPDWLFRQSAVIPYRLRDGDVEILLITSRNRRRWVIPKGVIEPSMTPSDSAANEAFEEAGLRGCVNPTPIGNYEYFKWGDTCHVEVFLMLVDEVLDQWPEASFRKRRWMSVEEAARWVDEPELKSLLRSVPALLRGR